MNKDKVVYYCHSLISGNKNTIGKDKVADEEYLYQVKVLDENNKDVILDYLGISSGNELLKFVVHIYITR